MRYILCLPFSNSKKFVCGKKCCFIRFYCIVAVLSYFTYKREFIHILWSRRFFFFFLQLFFTPVVHRLRLSAGCVLSQQEKREGHPGNEVLDRKNIILAGTPRIVGEESEHLDIGIFLSGEQHNRSEQKYK